MKKILLVDDEPGLVRAMRLMLQEAGYEFYAASDGVQALEVFDEVHPDLVVTDIMMPRMDGFELCEAVRKRDARVPLLLLSAKGDIVDKRVGFRMGADDYMTKPFEEEELLLRVEALLRRAAPVPETGHGESARLSVSDMDIDCDRREIRVGGKLATVTPREFEIVELLARNKGKVFTRDDIIAALWGPGYDHTSVNVSVYIRRIREKTEEDPANPRYVQTVMRFGYRMGD